MTSTTTNIDEKLATLWRNRNIDWEDELKTSYQLWQASQELRYQQGKIGALIVQANCFIGLNHIQEAFDALERAHELMSPITVNSWSVRLHFMYGEIYRNYGDFGQALEHYMTALDQAEALGNPDEISRANGNLAIMYIHLQEYDKAIAEFQNVLNDKSTQDDPNRLFSAYLNLASAYYYTNQPSKAIATASEALKLASSERELVMAHGNLGAAYLINGILDKAKFHLEKSYELSVEVGNLVTQCVCATDLADYLIKVDEQAKAIELLQNTIQIAQTADYKQGLKECHQRLYDLYRKQANWEQALLHHEILHQVDKEMFNEHSDRRVRNLEVLHRLDELRKINQRQKQEYQRLSEMKDTLLRDVSHDLRNPLNVINATVHILRTSTSQNYNAGQINELCNIIERQANKMLLLVTMC